MPKEKTNSYINRIHPTGTSDPSESPILFLAFNRENLLWWPSGRVIRAGRQRPLTSSREVPSLWWVSSRPPPAPPGRREKAGDEGGRKGAPRTTMNGHPRDTSIVGLSGGRGGHPALVHPGGGGGGGARGRTDAMESRTTTSRDTGGALRHPIYRGTVGCGARKREDEKKNIQMGRYIAVEGRKGGREGGRDGLPRAHHGAAGEGATAARWEESRRRKIRTPRMQRGDAHFNKLHYNAREKPSSGNRGPRSRPVPAWEQRRCFRVSESSIEG